MSTATHHNAPVFSLHQQFANLRRALGDFANALYAAQGRALAVAVAEPGYPVTPSTRQRLQGLQQLLALANQHQQHSPALSTELRSIASRG